MSKTLVIILSETRAHELTFNNFKKKSYRCSKCRFMFMYWG